MLGFRLPTKLGQRIGMVLHVQQDLLLLLWRQVAKVNSDLGLDLGFQSTDIEHVRGILQCLIILGIVVIILLIL